MSISGLNHYTIRCAPGDLPELVDFYTGTLQLKPTFLDGSPAHGGSIGLIRSLWRDARFTRALPMWAWIVETGSEPAFRELVTRYIDLV